MQQTGDYLTADKKKSVSRAVYWGSCRKSISERIQQTKRSERVKEMMSDCVLQTEEVGGNREGKPTIYLYHESVSTYCVFRLRLLQVVVYKC